MLDALQNNILNKPDSTFERRAEANNKIDKSQGSKFERLLSEQKDKDLGTKDLAKSQPKATKTALQDVQEEKGKVAKNVKSSKATIPNETLKDSKNIANKVSTKPILPTESSVAFEINEKSDDSKVAIKEKIANTSKDNLAKAQSNPLVEALAVAGNNSIESKDVKSINNDAKSTKGTNDSKSSSHTLQMSQINNAKQAVKSLGTQSKATQNADEKTMLDVAKFAQSQGLNPKHLVLEEGEKTNVAKAIPTSAKEKVEYEYENNVDRIAIVQRGVKKPKNITSKISTQYATKESEESTNTLKSLLKDRPPIG